jgi:hypothetical protein
VRVRVGARAGGRKRGEKEGDKGGGGRKRVILLTLVRLQASRMRWTGMTTAKSMNSLNIYTLENTNPCANKELPVSIKM